MRQRKKNIDTKFIRENNTRSHIQHFLLRSLNLKIFLDQTSVSETFQKRFNLDINKLFFTKIFIISVNMYRILFQIHIFIIYYLSKNAKTNDKF